MKGVAVSILKRVVVLLTAVVAAGPIWAQTTQPPVYAIESAKEQPLELSSRLFLAYWSPAGIIGAEDQTNPSDEPLLYRIDEEGKTENIRFSIPECRFFYVFGMAGARDGSLAVAGHAYSADGRMVNFLARISPDRKSQSVTQLPLYLPEVVALAGDGTAWTIGKVGDRDRVIEENVLRRIDMAGAILSSSGTKARATRRGTSQTPDVTAMSLLKCSKDRVGWLTQDGEYIEYSLDGKEIGRFEGPPFDTPEDLTSASGGWGMGISDSNQVFITAYTRSTNQSHLWKLNRQTQSWDAVQIKDATAVRHAHLLGVDGETLVVFRIDHPKRYVVRLAPVVDK